jgi:hypothetical protein
MQAMNNVKSKSMLDDDRHHHFGLFLDTAAYVRIANGRFEWGTS